MTAHARIRADTRDPRLWTADQFLEFYMTRPDEERWQLVDGLPIMMVPPSKLHQRIVSNLERLLNDALETTRPDLLAYGNIGVRIPDVDDFNPQPDVVVCAAEADQTYYEDEYLLVAEVVSPSNTVELMNRKLELYQSHSTNHHVLIVDQDALHVTLFSRGGVGWQRADLRALDDVLSLPAFGFQATLTEIYKGTPLARP